MLLFTWFFQAIEILQNHLLRGFQVIDLNSFSSKSFFKQSKSALKNGCNQLKFLHCDMKNWKLKKNSDFNDTTSDFHHSRNCLPNQLKFMVNVILSLKLWISMPKIIDIFGTQYHLDFRAKLFLILIFHPNSNFRLLAQCVNRIIAKI